MLAAVSVWRAGLGGDVDEVKLGRLLGEKRPGIIRLAAFFSNLTTDRTTSISTPSSCPPWYASRSRRLRSKRAIEAN